ncbi:PhnD/SsuA/transferrin family substrate-binding protein [Mycoplasma cottewii]|uniref:PhnD/SsuA/transferrin family substrate-binding protein n=1 Tax=Mycoplasma cottewii TaxID=51364 RepID=A0ABY5TWK0_9MOLU|nr:PhnD/SsuA/transferrin family substrate-binding protein [Mycoplasma cottewii]UWD35027.1 PhnD/SsuA/transferrin family substrate-binding protein [Mycoplasma cottewii]
MKKLISIMSSIGLVATSSLTAISCKSSSLEMLLVPSKSGSELIKEGQTLGRLMTKKLKELAKKRGAEFNKTVKVRVSDNYTAAAKSLASGSSDIGLMSIQPYKENRGQKQEDGTYDKIGFLLSSGRKGAKSDTTFKDFKGENGKFSNDKAISKLTGEELFKLGSWYQEYVKQNEESVKKSYAEILEDNEISATYYRTYVYANTNVLSNTPYKDGKSYKQALEEAKTAENGYQNYREIIKHLIVESNIKIGLGDKKSSSGFSYPMLWIRENTDLTNEQIVALFNKKDNDRKFVIGQNYDLMAETIGDNEKASSGNGYGLSFGFSDIRFNRAGKTEVEKKLFKNSEIIGASQAVINDGIMYSKSKRTFVGKDPELLKDVKTALQTLLKEDAEAREALSIYNITSFEETDAKIDEKITNALESLEDVFKIAQAI